MKFNLSIIETIKFINGLRFDNDDVLNFLNSQIEKLPDYMNIGIKIGSLFFNYIFLFIFLKTFTNLDLKKRSKIILIIKRKKIPILSTYIKFFESIIILKAFD